MNIFDKITNQITAQQVVRKQDLNDLQQAQKGSPEQQTETLQKLINDFKSTELKNYVKERKLYLIDSRLKPLDDLLRAGILI